MERLVPPPPVARNDAALRRAGPPVVAGLALLLGGITSGTRGWWRATCAMTRARRASLLGRVFAA